MQYFTAKDISEFKDINGNTPEILIVDGNRTAGKTTGFIRKMVDDYINLGKKFVILYRYINELSNCSEAIFKDVGQLFFPGHTMTHKLLCNGAYCELLLDGEKCGYCLALNNANKLKRYSHVFSDADQIFFDEYQSETGYIPNEIEKFQSIHTTIARGQGKPTRFVPVYMASNSITIFNPYYMALGITDKIKNDTKVYKGNGFVILRLIIKDVQKAQTESAFNRAFANSDYMQSAVNNKFLKDSEIAILKQSVKADNVIAVFMYKGDLYTISIIADGLYINCGGDENYPLKFGVTENDIINGFVSVRETSYFTLLSRYLRTGNVTYENLIAKNAFKNLMFFNGFSLKNA